MKLFTTITAMILIFSSLPTARGQIELASLNEMEQDDAKMIYQKSLDIIDTNVVSCRILKGKKCIRAGEFWSGFWIRDIAYSSLMGLWMVKPVELKNTFIEQITNKNGLPYQDSSGDFGGFPYQTDSLVWVVGAYELAINTNDEALLKKIYQVAKKMYPRYKKTSSPKTNLVVGAPSFLDTWIFLPGDWYKNKKKLVSNNFLSTNVLWARFQDIYIDLIVKYDVNNKDLLQQIEDFEMTVGKLNELFYSSERMAYNYFINADRVELLGNILISKFGYNDYDITYPIADNLAYMVIDPPYHAVSESHNWYSGSSQFIWTDVFAANVFNDDLKNVLIRYSYFLKAYDDIKEIIIGGDMIGGKNQLWGAVAMWSYLSPYLNTKN